MNIVLIDDDQLVCMSLKMILEASGDIHVSAIGHDGSDALPLYQQYRPDILLMDIRMQHRNGTDALSDVLEQFPDARVLFLTTFVDDEYITKALQLGAKGYIIKQDIPVRMSMAARSWRSSPGLCSRKPPLTTVLTTFHKKNTRSSLW